MRSSDGIVSEAKICTCIVPIPYGSPVDHPTVSGWKVSICASDASESSRVAAPFENVAWTTRATSAAAAAKLPKVHPLRQLPHVRSEEVRVTQSADSWAAGSTMIAYCSTTRGRLEHGPPSGNVKSGSVAASAAGRIDRWS